LASWQGLRTSCGDGQRVVSSAICLIRSAEAEVATILARFAERQPSQFTIEDDASPRVALLGRFIAEIDSGLASAGPGPLLCSDYGLVDSS
jgi:hypothetical protein